VGAKATEAHGIYDGEDTGLEQSTSCCWQDSVQEYYLKEKQENDHCNRRVAGDIHSERRGDYHPSEEEQEYPSRLDNKACKGRKEAANGESCMADNLEVERSKIAPNQISLVYKSNMRLDSYLP